MKFEFLDSIALGDERITTNGYYVREAKIARTGIQIYSGREVGRPAMDKVRVYRPKEEIFDEEALASVAHKPITNDHPSEMVTAKNWKKLAFGHIGNEVHKDEAGTISYIRVPLVLMDQNMIDTVKSGKRELSLGYTCDLDFTSGKTLDGQEYDAIQKNLRINHLAVVDAGRAGSKCRLGDSLEHPKTEERKMDLRKIVFDGITIEVTDAGAQAIEKLQKQLGDTSAQLTKANTEHSSAIAAKDKELATKDAELEKLKKEGGSEKLMDMVSELAEVIGKSKLVADGIEFKGKSLPEIRKLTVAKVLGDDAVKGKSDDYIAARFDGLVEDAGDGDDNGDDRSQSFDRGGRRDPIRDGFRDGEPKGKNTREAAFDENISYLNDAWQGEKKGAH